ncbi:MAG: hypothetical protein ACQETI_10745 [Halobacteriota archaeon]
MSDSESLRETITLVQDAALDASVVCDDALAPLALVCGLDPVRRSTAAREAPPDALTPAMLCVVTLAAWETTDKDT